MSSTETASSQAIPIGFQLYTVRGEFSRDVPGTLKRLSQIGYKAVELWGYAGTPKVYQDYTAPQIRELLDQNGLQCCGMHLELKALAEQNLERTIEINQRLANPYLTVAGAKEKMGSEAAIAELANALNTAAENSRAHGMIVGYHAHPFDFARINGRFAWEILFEQLAPEIQMQMDAANCLAGNGDPIGMLKKFPGRTPTIHLRDHDDKTFDSDFYRQIFELCETVSGTKWYIVEMGGEDGNGFDIPREALAKLKRVGK